LGWLVDPGVGGQGGCLWWLANESFGVVVVGGVERALALLAGVGGSVVVDVGGGVEGDAGVAVVVVVVLEELGAEVSGLDQVVEVRGERR